jgi:hypothetical protein
VEFTRDVKNLEKPRTGFTFTSHHSYIMDCWMGFQGCRRIKIVVNVKTFKGNCLNLTRRLG